MTSFYCFGVFSALPGTGCPAYSRNNRCPRHHQDGVTKFWVSHSSSTMPWMSFPKKALTPSKRVLPTLQLFSLRLASFIKEEKACDFQSQNLLGNDQERQGNIRIGTHNGHTNPEGCTVHPATKDCEPCTPLVQLLLSGAILIHGIRECDLIWIRYLCG